MRIPYEYVTHKSEIPLIIEDAKRAKRICLDSENNGGLDVISPEVHLLLVQLEIGGRAYVIDARKVDITLLREIIEDPSINKTLQNAMYDYKMLLVKRGLRLRGIYDTMFAESVLQAGIKENAVNLETLIEKYHHRHVDKSEGAKFSDHPTDAEFSEEQILYAANDVLLLPGIRDQQELELRKYGLMPTAKIEFDVIPAVANMELNGMGLDSARWKPTLEEIKKRLFKVECELRQVLPNPPAPPPKVPRLKKDGTPFKADLKPPKPPPTLNIDSWQQLAWALGECGIDLKRANEKTKKGLTNSDTIKFAASMYDDKAKKDLLKNILVYRGWNQTVKTFGDNLLEFAKRDGRIHPNFRQDGTQAGRFSCDSPNLENIQKKGEDGKILRSCFIPAPGHKFVIADYSQLHLRIAAEMSQDPVMMAIFADPTADLHKATAAQMFGVPYNLVTSNQRKAAKTINFGIIYGMGVNTLADRLGVDKPAAQELWDKYTEKFSVLMDYLKKAGDTAVEQGYAKTINGRIRWFPTLDQSDPEYKGKKAFLQRVGKNHPILGTDGDMLKTAMIMLDEEIAKIDTKMVNIIHDEVVLEVPYDHVIDAAHLLRDKMLAAGRVFLKTVPVLVDVKIRDSWWKDDGVNDDENGQQFTLFDLQKYEKK